MGVAGVNDTLKGGGDQNVNGLGKNAVAVLNKLTALVALVTGIKERKKKKKVKKTRMRINHFSYRLDLFA